MQDRNEYQQTARLAPLRQHYAQANAAQKPRIPTWLKMLVIVACIGLAGGLTGCGGGGSAAEFEPALAPSVPASGATKVL